MLESGLESGLGDYLALGPDPIVRELTSADRANVIDLFDGLSDRDRLFRFFRAMPEYSKPIIDLLTAMDGVDHVAYGALAAGRCVGAARFIRATSRPRSAEVAVTVAPEFRSRGIARLLVTALEQRAESCAIDTFEVNIYPENRGASALFRSLGFDTRFEGGVITGERSLGSLL
jgi:acetyltransferase